MQKSSASADDKFMITKQFKDFDIGRSLGEGSFSSVHIATDRESGAVYAIKILSKAQIVKEKKIKYVNVEKQVLYQCRHKNIIELYYTFQTSDCLYFVLEHCQNGDLLHHIQRLKRFSLRSMRYVLSSLMDAVEYLHGQNILHRDLKPENVLFDSKFAVKLCDFGSAKIISSEDVQQQNGDQLHKSESNHQSERRSSFVGTAEYCSPELLGEKQSGKASDLWSLGCILYQMAHGKCPFKGANDYLTFQLILHHNYTCDQSLLDSVTISLIDSMLQQDPLQRIGCQSAQHPYGDLDWNQIRSHQFFSGYDHQLVLGQLSDKKPFQLSSQFTQKLNNISEDSLRSFLLDKETILMCGKLNKRKYSISIPFVPTMAAKQRLFILTDKNRLMWIDTSLCDDNSNNNNNDQQLKQLGELMITPQLDIQLSGDRRELVIQTEKKAYHLQALDGQSIQPWFDALKQLQEL
ncbi:hypothetical protein MIR68_000797 [Amoeboaphelidium protococcarum]|nr:hypothetical protein MIR68_000797 [Amoeboaphelidium protococcarum]